MPGMLTHPPCFMVRRLALDMHAQNPVISPQPPQPLNPGCIQSPDKANEYAAF